MSKLIRGQLHWLILSALVLVADIATKHLVSYIPIVILPYKVFPGLNLVLEYNTGAAFGFLHQQNGWQIYLFIAMGALVFVALIFWLARMRPSQSTKAAAIALILGGALGNLYDRIAWGYVVDFIDIHLGPYHWPAFNVADSAITIGALLLIWRFLKE